MKKCPKCGQVYTENELNFCLNDGELLAFLPAAESPRRTNLDYADDAPTVSMDPSRITNQTWQNAAPVPWQGQYPAQQNQAFGSLPQKAALDQKLPTIALVLGIIACFMVCCAGGIWLGIPAAVLGYLGMRNADRDPNRYGGRGLAIAGLVIGVVTFLASLIFLIIGAAS